MAGLWRGGRVGGLGVLSGNKTERIRRRDESYRSRRSRLAHKPQPAHYPAVVPVAARHRTNNTRSSPRKSKPARGETGHVVHDHGLAGLREDEGPALEVHRA